MRKYNKKGNKTNISTKLEKHKKRENKKYEKILVMKTRMKVVANKSKTDHI